MFRVGHCVGIFVNTVSVRRQQKSEVKMTEEKFEGLREELMSTNGDKNV